MCLLFLFSRSYWVKQAFIIKFTSKQVLRWLLTRDVFAMFEDGTLADNVGRGVGVFQTAQEHLLFIECARRVVWNGWRVYQPGAMEKGFTTWKKTSHYPNKLWSNKNKVVITPTKEVDCTLWKAKGFTIRQDSSTWSKSTEGLIANYSMCWQKSAKGRLRYPFTGLF